MGVIFSNQKLLDLALVHSSYINENSSTTIQKKNKLINVKKFFLNKKKKLKKDIAIISPSKWLTSEINKSNLKSILSFFLDNPYL